MKLKLNRATRGAVILALFTAASVTACGEDNDSPSDDDDIINPEGGANASGGRSSSSSSGGSKNGSGGRRSDGGNKGDSDTDDDTDGDTNGPDGSGGGLVIEPEREDCSEEPNGETKKIGECWDLSECNGQDTVQFLNQCAGEKWCIGAYDNKKNIESYNETLPPLN